jgi:1-acyl-sn-glycerol-3-phosphate acyltransferase
MQLIRSLLFNIQMYVAMFLLFCWFTPVAIFHRPAAYAAIRTYCRYVRWSAAWMIGLKSEIRGTVPQGELIIAAKHQSFFDIILICSVIPAPRFIAKKELRRTPMLGWYARRVGCVFVDRGKRGKAIQDMVAGVTDPEAPKGQLVIYPQGTRVAAGADKPYKTGVGALYTRLGQTCVPTATNVGVFWPRSAVLRKPGLAVVEFLDPLGPDLSIEEFMAEIETRIETASDALMAEARGEPIPQVGTTRFRPPYTPVAMGAFAGGDRGRHHAPVRRSAMHDWHAANGAVFVEAGHWLRPQYYLAPDEPDGKTTMDAAITREVGAVRNGVGLVDVSTLGKIDIQGSDAGELLNRLYANGFGTLAVGKARYGLMLREDGIVYDDGTTSRLGEHHYLMTTTTAHAGDVMALIDWYLQVVWPELDVHACSVTEHWAAMALAGPRARAVLTAAVDDGVDVSDSALPFMGVITARIAGVPVRIFRISFSGELGYEINAPADWATRVWEALMASGEPHGIRPYGTEAMGILRIEKGHVTHAELDGRVTLDDAGMGRMASTKKWFVGSGMLGKPAYTDPARPKLVGLVPVDGRTRIPAGSILVDDPDASLPMDKLGHVSSSAYLSPTVGHPIALGFVSGGLARKGETVWAVFPLRDLKIEARITDPVFVDPNGERLRG